MKLATFKADENLTALTHRLFAFPGANAKVRVKEVEAALRAANPHLTNRERIPDGTTVVVPPIERAKLRTHEVHIVGAEVVQHLRAHLRVIRRALADAAHAEARELKTTLKNVERSREQPKAPKKRLAQIEDATQARLAELPKLTSEHEDGIAHLERDLDAFLERIS